MALGVILFQSLLQRPQDLALVLILGHIDKIDDDDAAQVAQPQLARNGLRRFQVGLEDGVVEIAQPDKPSGVHVDRRHGFSLIYDQIGRAHV